MALPVYFQNNRRAHFLSHLVRIWSILNQNLSAYLNVAFLLLLTITEEVIIFQIGLLTAKFYHILLLKDINKFNLQLLFSFGLIFFLALIKAAKTFVSSVLHIEWREHLSKLLLTKYFENLNYYKIEIALNGPDESLKLDNIDQRMSQDLDKLTNEMSLIISQLIIAPLIIIYYSYQVYKTIGYYGVFTCFGLFLISTLVNKTSVKSIVKWTYLKGKFEGDYRHQLKINCESISFSNGGEKTKQKLVKMLKRLLSVHENLILKQFYLNLVTTIFDYSGAIFTFIIIAVPIFNGTLSDLSDADLSRQISANTFICLYLINSLSRVISLTSNLANVNGIGYRISEVLGVFELFNHSDYFKPNQQSLKDNETKLLVVNKIDVSTPFTRKDIFHDVTFKIEKGNNLYICANSVIGKTSLLRTIKGLWPHSKGTISSKLDLNDNNQVIFLSKQSILSDLYLPEILYSADKRNKFVEYLNQYSLDFLNEKLTVKQELENLSQGQKFLLEILITFHLKPQLIFMDDFPNNLSIELIEQIYKEFKTLEITVVTLTNIEDWVRQYHSECLYLNQFT